MEIKIYRVYVSGTIGVDIQANNEQEAESVVQNMIDEDMQYGQILARTEHEQALILDALQGREVMLGDTEEIG